MEANSWTRIKQIFQEACELAPADRKAYLDEACEGSDSVRAEVETLLAAHDGGGNLLQSPTVTVGGKALSVEGPGTTIGRYKVLQAIGEGGFGSVYMAEQEKPVRRKVALKIIKLGMDTKQVIARFEAERQALALMDHPNIARVLDAGATDTGRPFFVMELVRGIPITAYCDQNNLTMRQRLELFQSVCSAVQHAHQKGIIHRDIKPSNVMVTLHDGVPVPKVIDFGIAKATNQRLTEKTLFTEYHQFVGTPQYMSPEQAEMSGLDVDTRTDIYALGVLLYELLTGTTPFDADRLRSMAYSEIHRVIREEEPDKPSTRLSTLGNAATETAKHRATDIAGLRKALSGDLDWIVMKAIEKDRTRRYDTANSLRLDLVRYLENEPVLASPPSTAYRVKKFLRRNRAAVIVFGTVATALLLGTGLATFGFLQARRERSMARAEAVSARAINDFFTDMLASVDPTGGRQLSVFGGGRGVIKAPREGFDRNVSVVEMLKRAGDGVEAAFQGKPLLEAQVRETIGFTLIGLGQPPAAAPHMIKAMEIRRSILPEDHPDRLRLEFEAALFTFNTDRVREVRDTFERVYGPDDPKTLSATSFLADIMTLDRRLSPTPSPGPSRFSSAGDLYRETLAKQRALLGNEHPDVLKTMLGWAGWYCWGSHGEEAEALAREAYETTQRILSPDHAVTLQAAAMLGWALNFQGRHAEAEKYLREAIDKQDRVLGPDHPDSIRAQIGLGRSLHRPEDLDEKERLWRRAVEELGNPPNWVVARDLAFFLVRRGKADDGIRIMEESYEGLLKILGERNGFTTHAEANLLAVLRAAGRHEEAREHSKAKLEKLRSRAEKDDATAQDLNAYAWELLTVWPPELRQSRTALSWAKKAVEEAAPEDSGRILDTLARALYENGDLPGAIEAQRKAVEVVRSRTAADAGGLVVDLVRYLTLAGDDASAMEETNRHVGILRESTGEAQPDLAATLRGFGRGLSEEGLWAPAEVPLVEALTLYESSATDPEDYIQLLVELSTARLGQGELDEAQALFARAEELSIEANGAESAEHASVLKHIATHLSEHGHDREAVPFIRRAIDAYSLSGNEEILRARRTAERSLAFKLARLGETAEAMRIARESIAFWQEEWGDSYVATGWSRFAMAEAQLAAGDHDSAEREIRKALDTLRRNRRETESPVSFAEVEAALAECLTIRGRYGEAESLLSRAYERIDEYGKDNPRARQNVQDRLVALYEAWGKTSEAAKWRNL